LDAIPRNCVVRHILISPGEIHFLRFIMEAYEGIGVVTTIDPTLGLVQLSIAPGCEEDVARILEEEASTLQTRPVTLPSELNPFLTP
jgi:hypothetical protein